MVRGEGSGGKGEGKGEGSGGKGGGKWGMPTPLSTPPPSRMVIAGDMRDPWSLAKRSEKMSSARDLPIK